MKIAKMQPYYFLLVCWVLFYRGVNLTLSGKWRIAEKAASEVICLPIYPELDLQEISIIIEIIQK